MDRIRNLVREVLSDAWYTLYRFTYEYRRSDGRWEQQQREAYDRGDGAAVLLYDPGRQTVVLTRQFRLASFINGNPEGVLTEVCAGVMEGDDAEACMRREILEETGFKVPRLEHVATVYTSPGAVTEKLHLYLAAYHPGMKISGGGGVEEETEDIEVLEWTYAEVLTALEKAEIRDAKTLILLQHAALYGPLSSVSRSQ